MNMQVTFMWFTAHRGLKGNEDVDALAKQADAGGIVRSTQ